MSSGASASGPSDLKVGAVRGQLQSKPQPRRVREYPLAGVPLEAVPQDGLADLGAGDEQPYRAGEGVQAKPERLGLRPRFCLEARVSRAVSENVCVEVDVRLPSGSATAGLLEGYSKVFSSALTA